MGWSGGLPDRGIAVVEADRLCRFRARPFVAYLKATIPAARSR